MRDSKRYQNNQEQKGYNWSDELQGWIDERKRVSGDKQGD